ncbi:protein of unknown function [Bacillus velezensis UCMB5033]|nr:protein of unknown function [Bacillus velezensis UCMB5033]
MATGVFVSAADAGEGSKPPIVNTAINKHVIKIEIARFISDLFLLRIILALSYELELIVKIFLMIVYQSIFLFLGGVKACQFALSLLNKTHLTHIEQRKPG